MSVRDWIYLALAVALAAVIAWIVTTYWNGLFWVGTSVLIAAIVWPELPGRIAEWISH